MEPYVTQSGERNTVQMSSVECMRTGPMRGSWGLGSGQEKRSRDVGILPTYFHSLLRKRVSSVCKGSGADVSAVDCHNVYR